MKNTSAILLISALCFTPSAWAENYGTPVKFIDNALSEFSGKCADARTLAKNASKKRGAAFERHAYKVLKTTYCDCLPLRAKNIKNSLPKQDQAADISESLFISKFTPLIVNKCLAEHLKLSYGEGCSAANSSTGIISDSKKFCSCMSDYVSEISEDDAAQVNNESLAYLSKAGGIATHEQSPSFKKFLSMSSSCAAK